ncbi:hypothetical protein IscW_ISCW017382 [Ixodes scapularis]|uniref:Uncharacterized protein n=1 Tax=Ixodes scapularis TaxID=6945 RepID=B7P8M0_IXOSC|nr:hypothetical protein IscW_ISCW017382 [Ixodes scapularis]|eukprot:XP_002402483.1 hypothetical protein IscW_ISCW017382 [Ixodes scapularis]
MSPGLRSEGARGPTGQQPHCGPVLGTGGRPSAFLPTPVEREEWPGSLARSPPEQRTPTRTFVEGHQHLVDNQASVLDVDDTYRRPARLTDASCASMLDWD